MKIRLVVYQLLGHLYAIKIGDAVPGEYCFDNQTQKIHLITEENKNEAFSHSCGIIVMTTDESLVGLPDVSKEIWNGYDNDSKVTFTYEPHKLKPKSKRRFEAVESVVTSLDNDPDTIFVFTHESNINRHTASDYRIMSHHKTREGAQKALEAHRNDELEDYIKTYGLIGEVCMPFGDSQAWKVKAIKLQE